MNWKEQFDEQFKERFFNFFPYNGEDKHHYFYVDIKSFTSTEIIEKLIADIPENIISGDEYEQGRMEEIKQQLISKWL